MAWFRDKGKPFLVCKIIAMDFLRLTICLLAIASISSASADFVRLPNSTQEHFRQVLNLCHAHANGSDVGRLCQVPGRLNDLFASCLKAEQLVSILTFYSYV